jgi:hypothetical protein
VERPDYQQEREEQVPAQQDIKHEGWQGNEHAPDNEQQTDRDDHLL